MITSRAADHVAQERGHGRISRWSTWVTDATTLEGIDLPHAAQLACIRRDVFDLDGTALSQVMATLRNLALSLLRRTGVTEITRTVQFIGRDRMRALHLIST
ncbi:hypothetical protein FHR32_003169 [Streptosporangium album]|uniref:Uncharacterized protein n=1 Tax=Streptosporangium album TaxID=47479 RepID=A0A7W7WA76_9ACTN|nr:hypothetical protein [Streptosporangium album]MBB4938864.1 hypothetical protein [Streptosporangium album]